MRAEKLEPGDVCLTRDKAGVAYRVLGIVSRTDKETTVHIQWEQDQGLDVRVLPNGKSIPFLVRPSDAPQMEPYTHETRIQHAWTDDPYRAFCTCGWESPHGRRTESEAQNDCDEHATAVHI